MTEIVSAKTKADIDSIRVLFKEYQHWLDADLCFLGFEEELASLPGTYGPPSGMLLLARDGDEVAGCVGIRPLEGDAVCEMKRLWVRGPWKRQGVGRRLAEASIEAARNLGYQTMKLDTLGRLTEALTLYRSMNFIETDTCNDNPLEPVIYMSLAL